VIDSFTLDDSTITDGETTWLRWEFHNATESRLERDGVEIQTDLPSPGDRPVNPHVTRTFKLVVSNAAGSAEASVTLTVTPAVTPAPVIHYFKVNGVEGDISINAGDSVTLEWDTDNAWGGVTLNGVGAVSPGSTTETPGATTTYTLIADNGAGDQVSLSRTVTVVPPTPILDQFQTATDYGFWFDDGARRWQEFKPTLGHVSAVEIYVQKAGNPGNVITEIRTVGGTVLAQKIANVPSTGWFTVEFPAPVEVSPGTKYRIYVYADQDSPNPSQRYSWRGSVSSAYDSECLTDVSSGWSDYDYAFKTFGY